MRRREGESDYAVLDPAILAVAHLGQVQGRHRRAACRSEAPEGATVKVRLERLLIDERPLLVLRSLVQAFGLQEAVFLQQLHYWLHLKAQSPERYSDHFVLGRYWVFWTLPQLQAEVPLGRSIDTYKRMVSGLTKERVLLVEKLGAKWDQTNWYSIDYAALEAKVGSERVEGHRGQAEPAHAAAQNPPMQRCKPHRSIGGIPADVQDGTETTSETTTTTEVAEDVRSLRESTRSPVSKLSLEALPPALHQPVTTLLLGVGDGQRFVDLLTSRLRSEKQLPEAMRIRAPILWLRKLLAAPSTVDFTEADAIAADRRSRELEATARQEQQRLAAQRAAAEQAAAEARAETAERALRAMTAEARAELSSMASLRLPGGRMSQSVRNSVQAGELPSHPLARSLVLRALDEQTFHGGAGKGQP